METKPRCGARNRAGQPCKLYPITGGRVCRMHGGKAPQVRAAAARRVVEADAIKAVSAMGSWSPVTDPLSALADVAGEVTAVKNFLRGLVDEIVRREQAADASPISGAMDRLTGAETLRSVDDKGGEQLNAKFQAYMNMLDRTVSTLATIAKLNIDERMARLDAARAELVMEALRRALAELGLAGEAQTRGIETFGRHLKVVARDERRAT